MDSVGEGEGGKIWENGIETCKELLLKASWSCYSFQQKKIENFTFLTKGEIYRLLVTWKLKFVSINLEIFYKEKKMLSSRFNTFSVRNNCALQQNGSQKKEVQKYQL